MSSNADGWHYYTFTASTTLGVWPTFISCGTLGGGDLVKEDKTFVIASSSAASVDTAAVANSVWNSPDRTLTSATSVTADIWGATNRSLTDYATSTIASAVWSISGRSLTSFGTLISDIWSYGGGRTLSSIGVLAADIWNNAFAPTRTLTSSSLSSGQLATSG